MHTGTATLASKRKYRTPSGQYSRAGEKDRAPTQVKRLMDAFQAAGDARNGSELGRLFLNGVITEGMYSAGVRWSEHAAKYRQAIGAFPVRAISMERGSLGQSPDPDSDAGQKIAKREADNAERFFEAHAVLVDSGGLDIVRRVCEEGQAAIGFSELIKLRTGLLRLASHWGLTALSKSASAENVR